MSESRAPQSVLDPYEILETLGEGGMGIVYRARDRRLRRSVALKVLDPDLGREPILRERFRREAIAASALDHPGIVTIHDVLENVIFEAASFNRAETDVIVMEYVAGGDLRQRISSHGMELRDALQFAIQIADAMQEAHGAGIVHRDLKPANLLIDTKGRVKIADFGIAKLEGDDPATTSKSSRAGLVGTLSYMSPEQISGRRVDARVDIFALGVVLYEMLAGERPFRGSSEALLLYAICHEPPPPLEERRPDVPPELAAVISRALAKKRSERYANMAALGADLEGWLTTLEEDPAPRPVIEAATPSTAEESTQPARPQATRRLPREGHLGPLLLLLLVPLAVLTTFWAYEHTSRAALADLPDRSRPDRTSLTSLDLPGRSGDGEDPMDADSRSLLALWRAERGDCGAALAEEGHVTVRPATVHFRLAVALELCGSRDAALGHLGAALAAGYSRTEIERAPRLLELREDVRYHRLMSRLVAGEL